MKKQQGKTIAKFSHVSRRKALNTSIRKLQSKTKNGHGSMKTSRKVLVYRLPQNDKVKTNKQTHFTNVRQFTFVLGSFRGSGRGRHTCYNLLSPSKTARLQDMGLFDTRV